LGFVSACILATGNKAPNQGKCFLMFIIILI
jgi:hypothetical protein